MMHTTFANMGLRPELLAALIENGYEKPSPIQISAIPTALLGHDILGCAQTGTGKTAAFSLPILQKLAGETFAHDPRCLILTPTRELATQVRDFIASYGRHLKLRSLVLIGGMPMKPQINGLKAGCDIVIATPGRLLDLENQRAIKLGHIEIMVLDEADRMLDMGFIPDVRHIMRLVTTRKQTLLFSATMPPEIERLARDFMKEPVRIQITPPSTPVERIRQVIHPVDQGKKKDALLYVLNQHAMDQVLIFTRTKRTADNVTTFLQKSGMSVDVIHGDKHQSARTKALNAFKDLSIKILVATDVASRGIDVESISHVINYDMPGSVEDYIHRIGRTARASAEGDAVSLVGVEDWDVVKEIEKAMGKTIPRIMLEGYEPTVCKFLAEVRKPDAKPLARRRRLLRGGRR